MMITEYGYAIGGLLGMTWGEVLRTAVEAICLIATIVACAMIGSRQPQPQPQPHRDADVDDLERAQSRELMTLLGEAVRDLIELNDTDHAEFRRRLDALEARSGGRLNPENPINWRSPCDDDDADSYP